MAADGAHLLTRRLAAVALLAAPVLAGCGGGGGGGSASPETVTSAAAKSSRAGSLQADFKISSSAAKGSGSGTFNTGGDSSGRSTLNLEVNRRVNAVDTIVTGNVLYLRSRVFAQAGIAGAKDWLSVDLGQLAQQGGVASSLANVSPTPTSALAYLRGVKDVKKVGTETVSGVDTTHYRVTSDLQRAAARSSGSSKQSIESAMQLTGRKTLPMDAWVDGQGYLRKVAWAQQASAGAGAKISMVLHDFGAPVKIEPPSGKVIDLTQRLSGGSG
jgi:hypothetical protein